MARLLVLAILAAAALEIWLLVEVGRRIGSFPTALLLLLSGVVGAWLTSREGRKAWVEAQRQLGEGQIPGRTLLDGLCILAGGLLLLLPGFLSDIVGLTLLLPFTRAFYRGKMLRWLEKRLRSGRFTITRR